MKAAHQFTLLVDGGDIIAVCRGGEDHGHTARLCWWQREFDGEFVTAEQLDFARLEYDVHHQGAS